MIEECCENEGDLHELCSPPRCPTGGLVSLGHSLSLDPSLQTLADYNLKDPRLQNLETVVM